LSSAFVAKELLVAAPNAASVAAAAVEASTVIGIQTGWFWQRGCRCAVQSLTLKAYIEQLKLKEIHIAGGQEGRSKSDAGPSAGNAEG